MLKTKLLKAVLAVLAVGAIFGPTAAYADNSPVTNWECYWCGAKATTPAQPKGSLPPGKQICKKSPMSCHGWVRKSGASQAYVIGYYWHCKACNKVVYIERPKVPFDTVGSGCKGVKDGYHRWNCTFICEYKK